MPIQLKLDGVSAQAANQEARSLIEQRIQSLVGTLSSVGHVFDRQVRQRMTITDILCTSQKPLRHFYKISISICSSVSIAEGVFHWQRSPSSLFLSLLSPGRRALKSVSSRACRSRKASTKRGAESSAGRQRCQEERNGAGRANGSANANAGANDASSNADAATIGRVRVFFSPACAFTA